MRQLPEEDVFSRTDLRLVGWSDPAVSRALCVGKIFRLRRDQFTAAPPDSRLAAIAAARGCQGSVVSHRSAAVLHGLPIVGKQALRPEVTVQPRRTGDLSDAHLCRATLRDDDVVVIDDVPVTSIARTIIDLGRHRPMATMVAAADFALHHKLTTLDELNEVLGLCRGWPGIKRAARALEQVDELAESPLESISRLAFGWLHLPPPKPQRWIYDGAGRFVGRCDFYWEEFGVVGEADGEAKLQDRDDVLAERRRHQALERLHLVVARWGWSDVVRTPRLLDARIRSSFDDGRRRDAMGFPRLWSVRDH
jgi:hypothetical protein